MAQQREPVGRPQPLRMSEWLRKLRRAAQPPFFTRSGHQSERPLVLKDFQDPTTMHPLSDPNNFITLGITAIPACFTSLTARLSGPDVAALKERMQAYTAQRRHQFVPHGVYLESKLGSAVSETFNNKLEVYNNTTVANEVVNALTNHLNKNSYKLGWVHRNWPDLLRWKEIDYNSPITNDEVIDQFDLILYEYLVHGVNMHCDIGEYVDMVLICDVGLSIDYILNKRGVIGRAEAYNAFNVGGGIVNRIMPHKLYSIFDQETNNPQEQHPRLTGMRFICVPGGGAAGAGHCYLDLLKFRFDPTSIPIRAPVPHRWGCNYQMKPDPSGNFHTWNCIEHQYVLVLSVRDRLDFGY